MRTYSVGDLDEFLGSLADLEMEDGAWAFRGLSDVSFDLVPSVGRPSVRAVYDEPLERLIFERFKRESTPYLIKRPEHDIGWLALARHSGLPTRLLDWTLSPLVAAYFATCQAAGDNTGFAIFSYQSEYFEVGKPEESEPFSGGDGVVEVHTEHFSERMSVQRGFFTLHRKPSVPFQHDTLVRFVFPEDCRTDTRNKLDLYGINEASLFPGLDGLASYWGWFYRISV